MENQGGEFERDLGCSNAAHTTANPVAMPQQLAEHGQNTKPNLEKPEINPKKVLTGFRAAQAAAEISSCVVPAAADQGVHRHG